MDILEVAGVESITAKYAITRGDGEINVGIEGLPVYNLSRPEDGPNQHQKFRYGLSLEEAAVFPVIGPPQ